VAAETDMVARNFQITAGYYLIGLKFCDLLDTNLQTDFNINWPVLATWASNTAGISIRKELPLGWFETVLQFLPKVIEDILLEFPSEVAKLFGGVLENTSIAMGIGNSIVWEEIGISHTTFGIYYGNLTQPDAYRNALFNNTICSEERCAILRDGMQWYYRAKFETNLKLKAEYICAANLLVLFAEQTKLQSYIENAMVHEDYTFSFLGYNYTFSTEKVITHYLISLVFPNEILNTGVDIPYLPGATSPWPTDLETFQSQEVRDVYLMFINQTTDLRGTAATRWDDLSQRMRFVGPLFRRSQEDRALQSCPVFTSAQFLFISKGGKLTSSDLCLDANCC
jgi:hypothetical protein